MIDVNVDHRRETERLEVGHTVVHVESKPEAVCMVEGLQWIESALEDHRQVGDLTRCEQRRRLSKYQHHTMNTIELLEDRDPLAQLIELGLSVAEVDHDFGVDIASVIFQLQLVPSIRPPDPSAGLLPGG